MRLNDRQRQILTGILKDQDRLAALPWGDDHSMSRDALGRHRLHIRQAREGLVPMSLETWLGHPPTNTDHVLCCRDCQRLEGMGLLVRCNSFGGRRTTHLKLTQEGKRLAEELCVEEISQAEADMNSMIDWSRMEFPPIEMPPETTPAVREGK